MVKGEESLSLNEKLNNLIKKIISKIKAHPIQFIIKILLSIYISGIVSQIIYVGGHHKDNPNLKVEFGYYAFIEWCTSLRGFITFLVILLLVFYIWKYFISSRQEENKGIEDTRKFDYAETGEYGTAMAMTEDDLKEILEFKSIDETLGIILGETYDGKVVSIPTSEEFEEKAKRLRWTQDDKTNNSRNKNLLVIGSPGTMKSRAIIMNQILQALRMGHSIIVTDPKGEMYEKTSALLRKYGYDVKMFNLKDQENSDSWNPLGELSGDSQYAKIFAETVVGNANADGEEYWNDNVMNIFKAGLMFKNTESLGKLYDFLSTSTLDELEDAFTDMDDLSVARRAYNIFQQCSEQVKGQILNGLGIMIDVFQDEKIRNITTSSEIDLTKPAREKCAYFVITSDQHRTFDFLAVLFWTMAFINLVEYIDNQRDENGDPTTLPIHLLLDEFPNIGEIPDFNRKLSTVRSRLLYTTIVIQNLPQLMNRYPNGMHEEIFSDCDFVVFLGCNDNTTADYISQLTGTSTILVQTENYVYDKTKPVLNQKTEFRKVKGKGQRNVMNKDEVRSIDNTDLLVFIRGTKSVYKCKKFDYSKHPLSKEIEIYKIRNHIPEWKKEKIEEQLRIQQEREETQRLELEQAEKNKAEKEKRKKEEEERKAREKKDKEDTEKAAQELIKSYGETKTPDEYKKIKADKDGQLAFDMNSDNRTNVKANNHNNDNNKTVDLNKNKSEKTNHMSEVFGVQNNTKIVNEHNDILSRGTFISPKDLSDDTDEDEIDNVPDDDDYNYEELEKMVSGSD